MQPMGFLEKFKKSMELKQPTEKKSIDEIQNKASFLEQKLSKKPKDSQILFSLYMCYVELSDTEKKIECMKKLSTIQPNDSYPWQQLADIYLNEVNDIDQAKYYQNKANNVSKFL